MRYGLLILFLGIALLCADTPDQNRTASTLYDRHQPVGSAQQCMTDVSALLRAGYRNYPSIHASRQMILAADAQVQSAKWNYFPTPSIDIAQRAGRMGATLRLEQPLWTGGKLDATRAYARSQQEEARSTLGESGYALAERIVEMLQTYIQAEGEIAGFSEGKEQLETLAQMLERRIGAGVSSESDRELLESRIAQIGSDLTAARARSRMAKAQLELLTGEPLQCAVGFEGDPILQQERPLGAMTEALLQTHPALQRAAAKIGTAEAEQQQADAAVMPDLSLRAEHQHGSLYADDVGNDTFVYAALTFNPGAGFSALSEMERARFKVLQATDEMGIKTQELKERLVRDYTDYHAALEQMESIQRTVKAAYRVLASYTRLFIAGKRQWLDLVNSSREVTQESVALATLRALWIGSAYRLALQTGQLAFEEKERP